MSLISLFTASQRVSLNLYLLTQDDVQGHDTYSSCVVVAKDEADARKIYPSDFWEPDPWGYTVWASNPDKVIAKLIGVAADDLTEGSVICAAYHAG